MRALPTHLPLIALAIAVCSLALLTSAAPASAANVPIVINNSTDMTYGNCNNNCTLRDAIILANNRDGIDTIRFSSGLANEGFPVGSNLPFIDTSDGIIFQGSGQTIHAVPYGSVDFGLVFAALYDETSSNDSTARNITMSGLLSVNDFVWDGIQVCGGFVLQQGCFGPVAGVTIAGANAFDNGHNGIRILGTAISNVSISGLAINSSDEDAIAIAATSDLTGIHLTNISATSSGSDGVSMSGYFASDISVTGGNAIGNHEFGYHITADNLSGLSFQGTQANDNGQASSVNVTGSLSNFTVAGSSFSEGHGIYLNAGTMFTGTISGNTIENNESSALILNANNAIADVTIQGNTISDNYGEAIVFFPVHGTGNVIRNNTIVSNRYGVEIYGAAEVSSTRVTISRNSIYGTDDGLGIDLDAPNDQGGFTPNDDGDADLGPNGLLNYPVFSSLLTDDQAVHGTACANCLVELFVADPDPTGYGEGKTFISDVMADGAGNFAAPICGTGLPGGSTAVTATATDALGNTSEFSYLGLQLTSAAACHATPTPTPVSQTPSPTPVDQTPTPTPVGQTPSPTPVGQTPSPTPTSVGPTPSPTFSPSPTPTLAPGQHLQGDLDCDKKIDGKDALLALSFIAGFQQTSGNGGCFVVGAGNPKWGDVNCDDAVDELDALAILAYAAGASPLPQHEPCTNVGATL